MKRLIEFPLRDDSSMMNTEDGRDVSTEASVSSTVSGGVNVNSGDVTGHDKITSAGGHIVHAEAGATVIIHGAEPSVSRDHPLTTHGAPNIAAKNPFHTNGRINDPASFFDRERLVREIRSELSKRSSVSLVGESQVGKSSLLYYLYTTRAEWLPNVAIEYIDLQRVFSEADFCQTVLKRIGVEGNSLQDLRDALETREVILLLDEVERIAEQDFSPRLHDLLRSLTQEKNFALCVATQRPLKEVFPPSSPTSPLHNVFTPKTLGPFSEADARRFLATTLAPTGVVFDARDIERLLRDSQCHPAKLQQLAKELYDQNAGD
jgi:hypothetical protein